MEVASARRNWGDVVFKVLTACCAAVVVVLIVAIFFRLFWDSRPSIKEFGLGFLTSPHWNPVTSEFGAASSIFGTAVSTLIAMVIAVPLSLVIALLLVELSHPVVSRVVGTGIELLAAIPSIIFGMWGLFVLAPVMQDHVQPFLQAHIGWMPGFHALFSGPPMGIGMLTAGFILALMILPFITAVARDSLAMVPPVLKEAAHGMGSTTWEATHKVSLRYCRSGIVGALFLGLGRALGETMAVTFVIGNSNRVSTSLFAAGNTIASKLANEFTEADEVMHLSSLVELALVLFVITFIFQVLAHLWLRRQGRMSGGHA
jgi:phosphate transport system permease protein